MRKVIFGLSLAAAGGLFWAGLSVITPEMPFMAWIYWGFAAILSYVPIAIYTVNKQKFSRVWKVIVLTSGISISILIFGSLSIWSWRTYIAASKKASKEAHKILFVWPEKPIIVSAEWEETHNIKLVNNTETPFSGVMIHLTVEKGNLDFSKSYLYPSSMGFENHDPKNGKPFMDYFVGNISPNSTRDFYFKANTGDSKVPAIVSLSISVKSDESLPFGVRKTPK